MEKIIVLSSEWMTSVLYSLNYVAPDDITIKFVNTSIEDYKKTAMELDGREGVDAFVAAANTKDICKYVKASVINIEVSAFDLLKTIKAVVDESDKIEELALMTFRDKIKEFEGIKDILKEEIEEIVYFDIDDLVVKLTSLKKRGITKVIGTSIVLEKAEELGIKGYVFYDKASLKNALDRAVEVVREKLKEKKKAKSWETIFNNTYGGIIVTDVNGTITEMNPFAKKILGGSEEKIIGRDTNAIFKNLNVKKLMKGTNAVTDYICTIDDKKFLLNLEKFEFSSSKSGVIISFQDITSVQKSEIAIRKNLHDKGFVAKATFDDILCKSKKMSVVKNNAQMYAKKDSTILLLGETGVGKEIFAQSIHNHSKRRDFPFVAINCAALSSQLLQSELFGYEEYSFTGAKKGGKQGLFEMANRGTIFLDEIGEIDRSTQAQLLRAIETGEIMRVGGERIVPIDVRIIAATNRDMWEMVERGDFREDLYYRLCVLEVKIPPLRERREDIELITMNFLDKYYGELPYEVKRNVACSKAIISNEWRGNIRELRNIIERFVAVYDYNGNMTVTDVLEMLINHKAETTAEPQNQIAIALEASGGNRQKAAEMLGISRTTLWRRINEGS